jgi:hypothetical protein
LSPNDADVDYQYDGETVMKAHHASAWLAWRGPSEAGEEV